MATVALTTKDKLCEKLRHLAKRELEAARSVIPTDPLSRFLLFVETLRVIDYWSVFQTLLPEEHRLRPYDFGILQFGWNRALEFLYQPLTAPGFPIIESTKRSRGFAEGLLHQFGRSVLLTRAADMIAFDFLHAEEVDEEVHLRMVDGVADQFLDNVEFLEFEELERRLAELDDSDQVMGWQLFERDDADQVATRVGRFMSRNGTVQFSEFLHPNIEEVMRPLIERWDTNYGVMMTYDSTPDIDAHFLVLARHLVDDWKTNAGFHPGSKFGELSVPQLLAVVTIVVNLHMRHIRFSMLAADSIANLNLAQSLTIWKQRDELEREIADQTGFDDRTVAKAIDAIAFRAEDQPKLLGHTSQFTPLLIDLGNGMMLRPVSSLTRNSFESIRTLQQWRNNACLQSLDRQREAQQRSELYAIFQGTRYKCIEGNITIREHGKRLTDVDAAIYDQTTGELALFQLKWQDYCTNDVRGLRSKASNLASELDDWAAKLEDWLGRVADVQLAKCFRLKLGHGGSFSAVHLFGISRVAARTKGFGASTTRKRLAIANLPQFLRIRWQVGPAQSVFSTMHRAIKEEMKTSMEITAIPFAIKVAGTTIRFHDLWCAAKKNEAAFPGI